MIRSRSIVSARASGRRSTVPSARRSVWRIGPCDAAAGKRAAMCPEVGSHGEFRSMSRARVRTRRSSGTRPVARADRGGADLRAVRSRPRDSTSSARVLRAETRLVTPVDALERCERVYRIPSIHRSILAGPLRYSGGRWAVPAGFTLLIAGFATAPSLAAPTLDAAAAGRFAALALHCVHLEYPNKISHVLAGDASGAARALTPVFYGCYDWHSAVHGIGCLRGWRDCIRTPPCGAGARRIGRKLRGRQCRDRGRLPARAGSCLVRAPYGLAWLLPLTRSCVRGGSRRRALGRSLQPLELEAAARIRSWLPKRIPDPIGEHAQTAFAFGLIRDWSLVAGDTEMRVLIDSRSRDYYLGDVACPLAYEPSGEDFCRLPCGSGPDAASVAGAEFSHGSLPSCLKSRATERRIGCARHRPDRTIRSSRTRRAQPEPRLDARGHRERSAEQIRDARAFTPRAAAMMPHCLR